MNKIHLGLIILFQLLSLISNKDPLYLEIHRARSHFDQTGDFTPLVVSLKTDDINRKVKDVDLICIVDVSGSMSGNKIQLVKESLNYLVNKMNKTDNFALITFSSNAQLVHNLTKMTSANKTKLLNDINNLYASGNTNIYSALEIALGLLKHDYLSGERVASMILLSDGQDNMNNKQVESKFLKLINDTNKQNYAFTLHTFGYGNDNDPKLMNNLARIKDGGYFFINILKNVQDAYLTIYGSLSTIYEVNLHLTIQSRFKIVKIFGMDEMYDASLTNNTIANNSFLYTFNTTIIQAVYGARYDYLVLLDIPLITPLGIEVLNATVNPSGLTAKYYWDIIFNIIAYEVYIKCISFTYFSDGYDAGATKGITIIKEGRTWIESNYNGTRDWIAEYDDAINDLNNFRTFGASNLLSKIRELKSSKVGIHYSQDNSYTKNIIYNSHNIDLSNLPLSRVIGQKNITFDQNINYYYFYLKEGFGTIHNLHFGFPGSSLIYYSNNSSEIINITSLSDYIEYYYWNETKSRIQNIIDFSHGGQFIIKKDFPIEFYSKVDGSMDVTFNIEFFKLEFNKISNVPKHLFEITVYIVDDKEIENLNMNVNSLPTTQIYNGLYDNEELIGKIIIKKEEILKYISSIYQNYLYVIIKKISSNKNIIYNHVEGRFIFFSMNNVHSTIPEGFYISSNISEGQRSPHLYTLVGKNLTIEFSTSGEELDCNIIEFQKSFPEGYEEFYNDYDQFIIQRTNDNNITYIDVINDNYDNITSDKIIISIYSKNQGHIAGSDISKLAYSIKYDTHPYIPLDDNIMTDNYTENVTDNYTENISDTVIVQIPKANVILLGFSKFIYIRTMRIVSFNIHFAHITEIIVTKILYITVNIKYKLSLRGLEESTTKKVECNLLDNNFNNQDKFNCTFDVNENEIDNIEIDKNLEFKDQNIDIIGVTPIAHKFMNNLQNVGDSDIFNKKLYILDEATSSIDNDNNLFNITGTINDKQFNYESLNLTINSDNSDEIHNISCKVLKTNDEIYTLQCNSKKEIKAQLDSAFSDLGNENLIVNFKDNTNNTIDFKEIENGPIKKPSSNKGLSNGVIVSLIVAGVALLILIITIIICLKKKKPKIEETNEDSTIKKDVSSTNL